MSPKVQTNQIAWQSEGESSPTNQTTHKPNS